MKTSLLLPALGCGLTMILAPARADEPAPSALTPEMQALLLELLKAAAEAKPEAAPAPAPDPVAQPVAPREARGPAPRTTPGSLQAGSLVTSGLKTGTLATSAPLGGRGTTGGLPRLSAEDWRALFPLKQERR